jgi:hypothetical protein
MNQSNRWFKTSSITSTDFITYPTIIHIAHDQNLTAYAFDPYDLGTTQSGALHQAARTTVEHRASRTRLTLPWEYTVVLLDCAIPGRRFHWIGCGIYQVEATARHARSILNKNHQHPIEGRTGNQILNSQLRRQIKNRLVDRQTHTELASNTDH